MLKWAKFIIALLLVPFCIGAVRALWRVLLATGQADTVWVAFVSGAACWLVILYLLPKPMLVYVFGHELTHAIWTWIFGGRVKRFKATAKGGHVVISKSNFIISLSPYFFPVYAILLLTGFGIGHLVWDWRGHLPWLHLLLGFAYAFHVTLTLNILQTRQSDITEHGYLFSAVVIFIGNILVLLIGIPLMTERITVWTAMGWWLRYAGDVFLQIGLFAGTGW